MNWNHYKEERNWDIFNKWRFEGKSQAQIARDYGLSRQRVHEICKSMGKRLLLTNRRSEALF